MLRRLHPIQPDSFAFTPENLAWARGQISKYPEGRQASAIIPLLWRAQEQHGWLTRPAIEHVASMLINTPIPIQNKSLKFFYLHSHFYYYFFFFWDFIFCFHLLFS